MRQIGTLPDEAAARRLADYLVTLDITGQVNQAGDGWTVWVHREEQVERARAELAAFRANPDDPRFQDVERSARAKRHEAERAEREHRRKSVELGGRLNVRTVRRCPVTSALIAASMAVGAATQLGDDPEAVAPLLFTVNRVELDYHKQEVLPGVTIPIPQPKITTAGLGPILQGQVWRLFTPMFVHFGPAHFLFNMIALWSFGGLIEMRKSWRVLAALALAAAPISFFAEYQWQLATRGPEGVGNAGGMSGVVYALFGYIWMKSDYEPESDIKVPTNSILWMLAWLFICMTGALGPIANAAHVAGLAFGVLVGVLPHFWADLRWRR